MPSFDWHSGRITRATAVTGSYRNTQNARGFFKSQCGDDFTFDRDFMAWLKSGEAKTMGQAADEWLRRALPETEEAPRERMSTLQADVVVLGAGMVGVSVAVHLQKRGKQVVLIDRRGPGEETSYGNGGLVQREAVFPHPFPREFAELRRIARNRSVDVYYHLSALPELLRPSFAYWRNSAPLSHAQLAVQWS